MAKTNFREQKSKGWSGKNKDHRHIKSRDEVKGGKNGKRVPVSTKKLPKITPNNWMQFTD